MCVRPSTSVCRFRNERFFKSKMDKFLFLLLLCVVGSVSSIPSNMRRKGRRSSDTHSLDASSDGVRAFLFRMYCFFRTSDKKRTRKRRSIFFLNCISFFMSKKSLYITQTITYRPRRFFWIRLRKIVVEIVSPPRSFLNSRSRRVQRMWR